MNTVMLTGFIERQHERREIELSITHLKQDLAAREVFITPTGDEYKALGSSDPDRKNVLEKCYAADPACAEIRAKIRELERRLSSVMAVIDEFEILRRADEWEITRVLAEGLRYRYAPNHNPAPEAALDVALQDAQSAAEEFEEEFDVPF